MSVRAWARARSNNNLGTQSHVNDDFINDDDDSTLGSMPSMSPIEDDYMDTSSDSENNN